MRAQHCSRVAGADGKVVQNIMEDVTLMSITWQIAKGMQHLSEMKVRV